ncbi:MAG: hypothetical protein ACRELG_00280 [Gemmataceae bacterium]
MIRKIGPRRWRLYSKRSGRNLGTYSSRKRAVRREGQVEYFKMARKRKRTPPRRKDGRFRKRR